MKRIFLITAATILTTLAIAKQTEERTKVDFYGVDFSSVNVVGAKDSDEKLIAAFDGINRLLLTESSKYNVGRYLNLDVLSLQIDDAINQTATLKDTKFKDKKMAKISPKEIVEHYPNSENNILLIIAKELNKQNNRGSFIAVVFDGRTKEIISAREISGKAAGFGLRNFWAGSLYDALKRADK